MLCNCMNINRNRQSFLSIQTLCLCNRKPTDATSEVTYKNYRKMNRLTYAAYVRPDYLCLLSFIFTLNRINVIMFLLMFVSVYAADVVIIVIVKAFIMLSLALYGLLFRISFIHIHLLIVLMFTCLTYFHQQLKHDHHQHCHSRHQQQKNSFKLNIRNNEKDFVKTFSSILCMEG